MGRKSRVSMTDGIRTLRDGSHRLQWTHHNAQSMKFEFLIVMNPPSRSPRTPKMILHCHISCSHAAPSSELHHQTRPARHSPNDSHISPISHISLPSQDPERRSLCASDCIHRPHSPQPAKKKRQDISWRGAPFQPHRSKLARGTKKKRRSNLKPRSTENRCCSWRSCSSPAVPRVIDVSRTSLIWFYVTVFRHLAARRAPSSGRVG